MEFDKHFHKYTAGHTIVSISDVKNQHDNLLALSKAILCRRSLRHIEDDLLLLYAKDLFVELNSNQDILIFSPK